MASLNIPSGVSLALETVSGKMRFYRGDSDFDNNYPFSALKLTICMASRFSCDKSDLQSRI